MLISLEAAKMLADNRDALWATILAATRAEHLENYLWKYRMLALFTNEATEIQWTPLERGPLATE